MILLCVCLFYRHFKYVGLYFCTIYCHVSHVISGVASCVRFESIRRTALTFCYSRRIHTSQAPCLLLTRGGRGDCGERCRCWLVHLGGCSFGWFVIKLPNKLRLILVGSPIGFGQRIDVSIVQDSNQSCFIKGLWILRCN